MKKYLDVFQLSEAMGRPVRQIRSLMHEGVIPFLKLGHRTILFDPEKVEKALLAREVMLIAPYRLKVRESLRNGS